MLFISGDGRIFNDWSDNEITIKLVSGHYLCRVDLNDVKARDNYVIVSTSGGTCVEAGTSRKNQIVA